MVSWEEPLGTLRVHEDVSLLSLGLLEFLTIFQHSQRLWGAGNRVLQRERPSTWADGGRSQRARDAREGTVGGDKVWTGRSGYTLLFCLMVSSREEVSGCGYSFIVELDRDAKTSLSPIIMSVVTQTLRCWIAGLVLWSLCFYSPTASPGIPILVALFNYAYFVYAEVWGGFTCHSALGEVRGLHVRMGSFRAPREFQRLCSDCQAWRHTC